MRLNVGCADVRAEGWTNVDREPRYGVLTADVLDGLPFADGAFEGGVAHHVLQMIPQHSVVDFLTEVGRVLQRGSYFRISVPSLFRAIDAYHRGDRDFFPNAGETPDEALCIYLSQNGATRSVFTPRALFDYLDRAGFAWSEIVECGRSRYDLAALDCRERESLFVEARR